MAYVLIEAEMCSPCTAASLQRGSVNVQFLKCRVVAYKFTSLVLAMSTHKKPKHKRSFALMPNLSGRRRAATNLDFLASSACTPQV